MVKASENEFPKVTFAESAAPSTPSSGLLFVYAKTDGSLYYKNDAGIEVEIGGAGAAPNASGARVYNSASIALTDGSVTFLTFNSERWDDASYHSTVTNTGRLTVPSTGRYLIGAHIRTTGSLTGTSAYLQIRKDGTDIIAVDNVDNAAGLPATTIVTVWDCTVGTEYFEMGMLIGGSSKEAIAAASYSPKFWIERIGDT